MLSALLSAFMGSVVKWVFGLFAPDPKLLEAQNKGLKDELTEIHDAQSAVPTVSMSNDPSNRDNLPRV